MDDRDKIAILHQYLIDLKLVDSSFDLISTRCFKDFYQFCFYKNSVFYITVQYDDDWEHPVFLDSTLKDVIPTHYIREYFDFCELCF